MAYMDPGAAETAELSHLDPALTMEYVVHGDATSGHRLVLIPGLGGAYWNFDMLIPRLLAFGYCVLALSNRGSGQTPARGRRTTTSEMAADVVALLRHLRWLDQGQVHILGLSMGGMVAHHVAALLRESVGSLLLLSTHGGGWLNPYAYTLAPGMVGLARTAWYSLVGHSDTALWSDLSIEAPPSYCSKTPEEANLVPPGLSRTEMDAPAQTVWTRDHFLTTRELVFCFLKYWRDHVPAESSRGIVAQIAACQTHCLTEAIVNAITTAHIPVLVLHGSEDRLVTPENAQALASLLDGQAEMLEGAAHGAVFTHPRQLVEMIVTFHHSLPTRPTAPVPILGEDPSTGVEDSDEHTSLVG